jgi:hypothetical protein
MNTGILYVVYNEWIRDPATGQMPYKIGITSTTVENRYYGLGLKMPGKFETLFAYRIDDYAGAEQALQRILKSRRINGEWFSIEEKELNFIKQTCEMMQGRLVTDEVESEIEEETEPKYSPRILNESTAQFYTELKTALEKSGITMLKPHSDLSYMNSRLISGKHFSIINPRTPRFKWIIDNVYALKSIDTIFVQIQNIYDKAEKENSHIGKKPRVNIKIPVDQSDPINSIINIVNKTKGIIGYGN